MSSIDGIEADVECARLARQDQEHRLVLALVFSVLGHFVLIVTWKLPPTYWQQRGQTPLSVSFRPGLPPASAPGQAMVEARKTSTPTAVVASSKPAEHVMPAAPATAGRPQTETPSRVRSDVPPVKPQPLAPGAPAVGSSTPLAPQPLAVSVVLTLGESGQVQQIIWNQLPALTNEQLRRVEAAIRNRGYGRGSGNRVIEESLDIRPFLKPPVSESGGPGGPD